MARPDAALLRRFLTSTAAASLDELEAFASIASTNTHLLSRPPPAAGRLRVAIADCQTAGRGRHDSRWLSAPGAGLCLSLAYTFATRPEQLPALTLAIGVGIVSALRGIGLEPVRLKWPNDLLANDGKLGGVLTELQTGAGKAVTVVAGVGLNVDLSKGRAPDVGSGWAATAVDLRAIDKDHPPRERIAAELVNHVHGVMRDFERHGFAGFADAWRQLDWLQGRAVEVDTPTGRVAGIARGVDDDGALLVEAGDALQRIVNGSVQAIRPPENA